MAAARCAKYNGKMSETGEAGAEEQELELPGSRLSSSPQCATEESREFNQYKKLKNYKYNIIL